MSFRQPTLPGPTPRKFSSKYQEHKKRQSPSSGLKLGSMPNIPAVALPSGRSSISDSPFVVPGLPDRRNSSCLATPSHRVSGTGLPHHGARPMFTPGAAQRMSGMSEASTPLLSPGLEDALSLISTTPAPAPVPSAHKPPPPRFDGAASQPVNGSQNEQREEPLSLAAYEMSQFQSQADKEDEEEDDGCESPSLSPRPPHESARERPSAEGCRRASEPASTAAASVEDSAAATSPSHHALEEIAKTETARMLNQVSAKKMRRQEVQLAHRACENQFQGAETTSEENEAGNASPAVATPATAPHAMEWGSGKSPQHGLPPPSPASLDSAQPTRDGPNVPVTAAPTSAHDPISEEVAPTSASNGLEAAANEKEWEQMSSDEQLQAETVGFSSSTWRRRAELVKTMIWGEMTTEQQFAAEVIGYDQSAFPSDVAAAARMSPKNVGDAVEANFKCEGKWFSCVIVKDHGDGTFAVQYTDGDYEDVVKREHIRAMARRRAASAADVKVRAATAAKALRRESFSAASAAELDREEETGEEIPETEEEEEEEEQMILPSQMVMHKEEAEEAEEAQMDQFDLSQKWCVGDAVEANCRGEGKFYGGTIVEDNGDGTFAVRYVDGDFEERVRRQDMRAMPSRRAPRKPTSAAAAPPASRRTEADESEEDGPEAEMEQGDEEAAAENNAAVEAEVEGTGKAQREEETVPKALGDAVEANWKGTGRWFGGTITVVNDDGTYDVKYVDGDFEAAVRPEAIRTMKKRCRAAKRNHAQIGGDSTVATSARGAASAKRAKGARAPLPRPAPAQADARAVADSLRKVADSIAAGAARVRGGWLWDALCESVGRPPSDVFRHIERIGARQTGGCGTGARRGGATPGSSGGGGRKVSPGSADRRDQIKHEVTDDGELQVRWELPPDKSIARAARLVLDLRLDLGSADTESHKKCLYEGPAVTASKPLLHSFDKQLLAAARATGAEGCEVWLWDESLSAKDSLIAISGYIPFEGYGALFGEANEGESSAEEEEEKAENQEAKVAKIMEEKGGALNLKYRVRWKGQKADADTWESEARIVGELDAKKHIIEYHRYEKEKEQRKVDRQKEREKQKEKEKEKEEKRAERARVKAEAKEAEAKAKEVEDTKAKAKAKKQAKREAAAVAQKEQQRQRQQRQRQRPALASKGRQQIAASPLHATSELTKEDIVGRKVRVGEDNKKGKIQEYQRSSQTYLVKYKDGTTENVLVKDVFEGHRVRLTIARANPIVAADLQEDGSREVVHSQEF